MLKSTQTLVLTVALIAAPLGMLTGALVAIHTRPEPEPTTIDFRDFQVDGDFGQWEVVVDPDTGRWIIRRKK